MKALITTGDGQLEIKTIELPLLTECDLLIKVHSCAQNPNDWKTVALHKKGGNILGCDFSGVVVKIGEKVPVDLHWVSKSIGDGGGKIAVLLPARNRNPEIEMEFILAYLIFGKPITFPFVFESRPDHYENAVQYGALMTKVLAELPIQTVAMKLYPNGLASIPEGLRYMQNRNASITFS
ncbi:hypothetical protein BDP27DRAFT_1371897 [Rhodocollybia butyracea]|uniref:Alcohol dehydrogenase-like N-terminal domain-containing protein n=1 Tax=Rhodocollybia butyracea TaxID=206335 RepID=A0A9P5TZ42_9AGAR|nr:hypothetical protein BDP27DRAFT_1371897 [Rhodocollybia butyracea]